MLKFIKNFAELNVKVAQAEIAVIQVINSSNAICSTDNEYTSFCMQYFSPNHANMSVLCQFNFKISFVYQLKVNNLQLRVSVGIINDTFMRGPRKIFCGKFSLRGRRRVGSDPTLRPQPLYIHVDPRMQKNRKK